MRLLLELLVVGYLPGALLFRMPVLDRARRERLDAGERLFWAAVLSFAVALATGFALAAAGRFEFRWVLTTSLTLAAALLVAFRSRLRMPGARPPDAAALLPLLLVALCAWLYPPPSEYVIGGKDPGVYMNAGIQIAQRGGLVIHDPLVASLPPETRGLFFPSHITSTYYGIRFMGFFLTDPVRGTVVDQFPHLYPVAVAIGYGLEGLTGARYALPVCAVFGVLSLYFIGARLGGRAVGLAAGGLLAMHVVQVWYARYPNAEMIAQALLLAGLLALARTHVDDDRFFAPPAALLLGLVPFARIDGIVALTFAAVGAVLLWVRGARLRLSFLLPLTAMGVLFTAYFSSILAPYMRLPLIWLQRNHEAVLVLGLLTIGGIIGLAWVRRRAGTRVLDRGVPTALVLAVVGLAVYAFFFRHAGGRLAVHDASSLRMYAWYVHPAALVLALLGLVLLARHAFWRQPALFTAACGTAAFVFYRLRIVPEHFWVTRRFLLIILPMTMLCIAAALMLFGIERGRQRAAWLPGLRWGLRLLLLAMVAGSFWQATRAVLPHVEYGGIIPRLEALAARFGPDDLLIVESRNASDLHVLALPLAYIYARPVLVLNSPKPDKLVFARFLQWARQRYDNVYFLGGGGTDLLSRDVGVQPVASEYFQVPEYESPRNAYPRRARRKEFDFGIYRFVAPASDRTGFALDLGTMDDLHVVRFHAKERDARGTFRWTGPQSYLSLTGITPDTRQLVLWMENGGRPASAPPARVEVYIAGIQLGAVVVGAVRQAYSFEIPIDLARAAAASADAVTIRLVSTTWNPRALLGVPDSRNLGVMVSRVEVRESAPPELRQSDGH